MPDTTQLMFKPHEVLVALLKEGNIHEGKWQLVLSFAFSGMNMGPTETEVVPGAAIAVTGVGLQRALPESPAALVADAAIVNPASSGPLPPS